MLFLLPNAKVAQLVEHDLAKVGVAGSNPVSRSKSPRNIWGFFYYPPRCDFASWHYARMVELVDTQDLKSCGHCGRAGSTPAPGTTIND